MAASLIVMSGLPGTGKTGVAEALAARLRAPVFSKDWLEASLIESAAVPTERRSAAGYGLLTTLAGRQLALGQSAILDCVVGLSRIRTEWRELALRHHASWLPIECVCSDARLHRERLEKRRRGIPGWPELAWSDVERARGYFEPWSEERLVLDSVAPREENICRAASYVGAPGA